MLGHLSLVKRKRDPFWKLRARKCLFSLVSNFIFISGRGKRPIKGGFFFTTIDLKCQKTNVRPLHSINKKYVMSFARHCNMEFVS